MKAQGSHKGHSSQVVDTREFSLYVTYADKERILGEEATVTHEAFAKRAEERLDRVKYAGNLLCVPEGVTIIVAVNGEGLCRRKKPQRLTE
jgi:hypothetical protein